MTSSASQAEGNELALSLVDFTGIWRETNDRKVTFSKR